MKHFVVNVAHSVVIAILEQARFIEADKPIAASVWIEKVWDKIQSLESFPHRHPISEKESRVFGCAVRKLVIGNYMRLYTIDEASEVVEAVQFRHAARLPENSLEAGPNED